MAENRHFRLIVVGENPDELIKKYDGRTQVEPYVVMHFKDAKKLHEKYINFYGELLKKMDRSDPQYMTIETQLREYEGQDDNDFYLDITDAYEIDEETGDAISRRNPYGKYDKCHLAGSFALPLINKKGEEVYSCRKSDVDWEKIHLYDSDVYEFAWDSVMGDRKPETDNERIIYENMKERKEYFMKYGTRENYVASNTSFWGYAFLSDKIEWTELEDTMNQFEWARNFFERFITPLADNEKITIYECTRFE